MKFQGYQSIKIHTILPGIIRLIDWLIDCNIFIFSFNPACATKADCTNTFGLNNVKMACVENVCQKRARKNKTGSGTGGGATAGIVSTTAWCNIFFFPPQFSPQLPVVGHKKQQISSLHVIDPWEKNQERRRGRGKKEGWWLWSASSCRSWLFFCQRLRSSLFAFFRLARLYISPPPTPLHPYTPPPHEEKRQWCWLTPCCPVVCTLRDG